MKDDEKPSAYDVGYRRPPRATQFKKGQSGNARGRPKGATNNKKRIKRMLDAPNPVRVGDQERVLSTIDLSLERIREGVRKGDKSAIARAISLALDLDKHDEAKAAAAPSASAQTEPPTEEDQAILLDYLTRQKALKEAF